MSSLHSFLQWARTSAYLRAPMAAAISPFMSPTEPSQPMMSDDVSDEDRPQHRELRPLLFSNSVWVL